MARTVSEVTIPLGLLLLGTGAMLWQVARADRERRQEHPAPPAAPRQQTEEDHVTQAR